MPYNAETHFSPGYKSNSAIFPRLRRGFSTSGKSWTTGQRKGISGFPRNSKTLNQRRHDLWTARLHNSVAGRYDQHAANTFGIISEICGASPNRPIAIRER
ncbi:MAG: hypothetical protein ACRD4C_12660 [Candidatus Acidiferrales bacterium]